MLALQHSLNVWTYIQLGLFFFIVDKQRREHKHELHMNVQVLGEDKIPEITKREELEVSENANNYCVDHP